MASTGEVGCIGTDTSCAVLKAMLSVGYSIPEKSVLLSTGTVSYTHMEKYGTWMYGLNKLYLLMEKQHNRVQEGAGLACGKLEANPGEEYMFRERA